jgi:ribosomal protein S27AE
MENIEKATVTQLKCSNCGSSHFTASEDDTYVCNYCGSTIKLKDNIQDKFVSFFKPTKSKTINNIHVAKPFMSKEQFAKNSFIKLGMTSDTPEDILDARFDKVKQTFGYYIVFDVEFTVITISTDIRAMARGDSASNAESETYKSCVRVVNGDEVYSEVVLTKLHTAKDIWAKKVSREEILSLDKNFPAKEEIKTSVENQILRLKQKLQQTLHKTNVKIIHNVTKTDLYIVPEYSLNYEYNNKKYSLRAISCEDKLYGELPKAAGSSLDQQLKEKSKKLFIAPLAISAAAILFFLLQLTVFRSIELIKFTVMFLIASVLSFVIANALQKPRIVSLKTQYFEQRRKKVEECFKTKKLPEVDSDDETAICQYMRWY